MQPPTQSELEGIAGALRTQEGLVEKDWHVVRALAALASIQLKDDTKLVFCGGTSLSRGWGLLRRFSEDIDFRVWSAQEEISRPVRRLVRSAVQDTLQGAGFAARGEPRTRDATRFVEMTFDYGSTNPVPHGLRAHLKVELTMTRPRLPPVARQVTSFVGEARGAAPEVPSILCLDPVETAAEKLSALAWRGLNRRRGDVKDDPAIVRHLYDLAALERRTRDDPRFDAVVRDVMRGDAGRGKTDRPNEPHVLLPMLLAAMEADPLWQQEYDDFVHEVTYGPDSEIVRFGDALSSLRGYAERLA